MPPGQFFLSGIPEIRLIPTLTRLIKSKMAPRKPASATASLKDLQSIRTALLQCMDDCDSVQAHRLRHKIAQTKTAQELWMLRNDAYQLISQQTSQAIAAERINNLISVFDGWLEPRQLVRIK
jgi:NAD-dependent DNA ligase